MKESLCNRRLSLAGCHHERRISLIVSGVGVGPLPQQAADHLNEAALSGQHQGGIPSRATLFQIGTLVDESLSHGGMAVLECLEQGRLPFLVGNSLVGILCERA